MPACPHATQASRAVWLCTDGASVASTVFGGNNHAAVDDTVLRRANVGLAAAVSTTLVSNASRAAFSQIPRGALVDGEPGNVAGETYMGYTMRADAWR